MNPNITQAVPQPHSSTATVSTIIDDFGREATGPLAGLVIADFSRILAGPYCTMLLADMGATVIKVEGPAGDDTRGWMPPVRDDMSTYYMSINRNKRSIALDFANQTELDIAKDIASRADVMIENFKAGGLKRFGLDYDCVARSNTDVIYASITGFGSTGGASLPGYDLLAQAQSGLMSLTGEPDAQGYRCGVAIFDVVTGLHAALGILAALKERSASGTGQKLEVNLMSSALSGMVNATAGFILSGNIPSRLGNEHASLYPYGPFPTGDGELIIAVGNNGQFRRFCEVLGAGSLYEDPRFSSAHARCNNRDTLGPIIKDHLKSRSAAQWFQILSDANLPCAPINDIAGGIDFAERIGLQPVVNVGHGAQELPGIRNPISFSRTPASYDLIPPGLDADRDSILTWLQASSSITQPLGTTI